MRTLAVCERQVTYTLRWSTISHCLCIYAIIFAAVRPRAPFVVRAFQSTHHWVPRSYHPVVRPRPAVVRPLTTITMPKTKVTTNDEDNAKAAAGKRKRRVTTGITDDDENATTDTTAASPTTRKSSRKPKTADSIVDPVETPRTSKKKAAAAMTTEEETVVTNVPTTGMPKVSVAATAVEGEDAVASKDSPSKKSSKKVTHQILTERDELPKLWNADKSKANGSYTFKIASWNVAGLRALLRNHPTALADLVAKHDLDVLCLQETKLQDIHLDDPKLKIRGHLLDEEGFDAYYSCSTEKKGYSGTAVFIKRRSNTGKKQKTLDSFLGGKKATKEENEAASGIAKLVSPVEVSVQMGRTKHDTEGRLVVVDFPLFSLCNVYVPNSGQGLKRLQYRTEEWDTDFLSFMEKLQKERGLPVMWLGDLNVAHTNLEVWNDGAKHLPKQAGVTPEERASFQKMLDSGWVDAFRKLHPTAKGHYSYWSQRAGNREPNKGLRLDYFICHPTFFDESSAVIARDSYMVADHAGSDHCPVVLELEIKG